MEITSDLKEFIEDNIKNLADKQGEVKIKEICGE
jgi:hypothetical protein